MCTTYNTILPLSHLASFHILLLHQYMILLVVAQTKPPLADYRKFPTSVGPTMPRVTAVYRRSIPRASQGSPTKSRHIDYNLCPKPFFYTP